MKTLRSFLVLSVLVSLLAPAALFAASGDWSGWGGPNGDFSTSTDPGLATEWGAEGPKVLWTQALGDHGHSSIVVEGETLYTSFRRGDEDVTRAVDVVSGEIRWESSIEAPLPDNWQADFGPGPHSTPLVAGDLVISASANVRITAFDRSTGEQRWQRDLIEEEGVNFPPRGYGPSPLGWNDLVIVNGGGEGQGLIALERSTGRTVWKAVDGNGGYSSPTLMTLDGVEQVVAALGPKRAGVVPATGELLWELDLPDTAATTMSTPIQVGPNRIFTSSAYADGSRVIDVSREGGVWKAEAGWYTRKMRIMHGTVAHFDGYVYGSSGDFGPTFLAAVDLDTGDVTFRQRGFAKANLQRIGEYVLILDEDGVLAIGRPSPEGIEILAEHAVLDGVSWSTPTLVGTTLLVRNRESMAALDLAAYSGSGSGAGDRVTEAETPDAFERTAGGLSLVVPPELLESNLPYYVFPHEDEQVVVSSDAPLQRNRFISSYSVGFLVAPFDLDSEEARRQPILGGAVRIPMHSLTGGSSFLRGLLFGGEGFDIDTHPEILVTFKSARDVVALPSDDPNRREFDLNATVEVQGNGRTFEVEAPIHLVFQAATMDGMNRYPGDLAVATTSFEIEASQLGVDVPPPLQVIIAPTWTVDLYLGMTTVPPDKTLNPAQSQELTDAVNRYRVLARDLGDDLGAYRHFEAALEAFADDAEANERLSQAVLLSPGIQRRNLGLALRASRRAVELSERRDPMKLNTLARVLFERGDVDEAVEVQQEAVALVGDGPNKVALEANLDRYTSVR